MSLALVTGDKGFVGRHFVRYLEEHGWDVAGCDVKDGYDARTLFRMPERMPVDLVVHCAAVVGGRRVIDGAPMATAVNLELDAAMFQWAMRSRPSRVLYFSSSAVYPCYLQNSVTPAGQQRRTRLNEHAVQPDFRWASVGVPDQLYGWAKLTGENLAHRARQSGLNVSVVRPFSGYGEDQDASYPFPAFIDRALRREDPFDIWSDGSQVRDFVHIDDIVRACMAMYGQGIDGPVNLGSGQGVSMTELAALVCERAGYQPEFRYSPEAPRGVTYRVSNNAKLLQFYEPAVSLEQGIDRALAWRKEHSPL